MDNDLISVVVPIYNMQNKISRCIESIINQTYRNIEIVLIDDGSTDDSGIICKKYLHDNRIKYIRIENGGVSNARNVGISNSNGKYICFVDSDDYVENNFIEYLYDNIDENTLPISGFYSIFLNRKIKNNFKFKKSIKKVSFKNINKLIDKVLNCPWNKLFIKDKISSFFDVNIKIGEDLLFVLEYLKNIENIIILPNCTYNYDNVGSSVTRSINRNRLIQHSILFVKVHNVCEKIFKDYDKKALNKIYKRDLDLLIMWILNNSNEEVLLEILEKSNNNDDYINAVKLFELDDYYLEKDILCKKALKKNRTLFSNIKKIIKKVFIKR